MKRAISMSVLLFFVMGSFPNYLTQARTTLIQPAGSQDTIFYAGEQGIIPDVQIVSYTHSLQSTATDIGKAEDVFRGPITFSIVYATVQDPKYDFSSVDQQIGPDDLSNAAPTPDASNPGTHRFRLFIDLQWSGLEQAESQVTELEKQGMVRSFALSGITFQLFEPNGGAYIGEIIDFFFKSPQGGWVEGDIPSDFQQIEVQPVRLLAAGASNVETLSGRWEINLMDITPHPGHIRSDICQVTECLPASFLTQFAWSAKSIGPIPVLCPNQMANGVTIQRSWFETRPIWWDDTRQTGFNLVLSISGQKVFMVQMAQEPSDRTFFLVSQQENGSYIQIPMDKMVLYDGGGKSLAMDTFFSGLRSTTDKNILFAHVPQGFSVEKSFLIESPFGPVWRLACTGK